MFAFISPSKNGTFNATSLGSQSLYARSLLAKIVENIPQRRLGSPHAVTRVVGFLIEDDSSFITGAVYSVNGGLDM